MSMQITINMDEGEGEQLLRKILEALQGLQGSPARTADAGLQVRVDQQFAEMTSGEDDESYFEDDEYGDPLPLGDVRTITDELNELAEKHEVAEGEPIPNIGYMPNPEYLEDALSEGGDEEMIGVALDQAVEAANELSEDMVRGGLIDPADYQDAIIFKVCYTRMTEGSVLTEDDIRNTLIDFPAGQSLRDVLQPVVAAIVDGETEAEKIAYFYVHGEGAATMATVAMAGYAGILPVPGLGRVKAVGHRVDAQELDEVLGGK